MTEKRFTAVIYDDYEKSLFFDNERKEQSLTDNEILNLLNELNEELESREKAHTRCDELYQKLYDENEELKKILKFLRNDNATDILNVLNSQENQIWELKKEVEQLKNKIKTYNSANELLKETIDRLRSDG